MSSDWILVVVNSYIISLARYSLDISFLTVDILRSRYIVSLVTYQGSFLLTVKIVLNNVRQAVSCSFAFFVARMHNCHRLPRL